MSSKKKLGLTGNELVVLRNGFIEVEGQELTLMGWHLFYTFISKLDTRKAVKDADGVVEFTVDEFNALLGNGRPNIGFLKESAAGVTKFVNIPLPSGGFKRVPLFSECTVDLNPDNEWIVRMVAEKTMLPYFYEISEEFFEFRLRYCLALNSVNREKLYMILKRFEGLGTCEIEISRLRVILGIKPDEYKDPKHGWSNFKIRVLDACRDAMLEHADIYYDYEAGRKTPRGSWQSVVFKIKKNDAVIKRTEKLLKKDTAEDSDDKGEPESSSTTEDVAVVLKSRSDFEKESDFFSYIVSLSPELREQVIAKDNRDLEISWFKNIVGSSFTDNEISFLYDVVCDIVGNGHEFQLAREKFFQESYEKLLMREIQGKDTNNPVKNRFTYFVSILKNSEPDLDTGDFD